MRKVILKIFAAAFLGLWMSASMCTKVVVYSTDTVNDAVSRVYSSNIYTVFEQAKKALEGLGYQINTASDSQNNITTGWLPTLSDSHYMDLFKRRDYAASAGTYYQLNVVLAEEGNKVKVSISTTVKSICGKLNSSHVVENKVLARLDDLMRSPQIEMTNVGVTER